MKKTIQTLIAVGTMILGLSEAAAIIPPLTEDFTTTEYQGTLTNAVWDTVAAHVTLPSFTPTAVGGATTASFARDVAVEGIFAYVADGSAGLTVVNIADPAAPFTVTTMATGQFATGIAVRGNLAYIADGNDGLQVVDISNPHAPAIIGSYDTPDFATKVDVSWPYAYVADAATGVVIVDVSDPTSPTLDSVVPTQGDARDVFADGPHVYIAEGGFGLMALDVSDPTNRFFSGWYPSPGTSHAVMLRANYAYLAAGNSGLQVFDITDPTNIQFVGSLNTGGSAENIHVEGNRAYLAATGTGFQAIDITDPDTPVQMFSFNTQGSVHGVIPRGDLAFLADGFSGLQVVRIGHHLPLRDFNGSGAIDESTDIFLDGNLYYMTTVSEVHVREATNPGSHGHLGHYAPLSGSPTSVWAQGNRAYLGVGATLEVLDVTDPAAMAPVGTFAAPAAIKDIGGSGHLVHLVHGSTIELVDVADPTVPVSVGSLTLPSSVHKVHVDGQIAYLSAGTAGVHLVDVGSPTAPALLGTFNTAGSVLDAYPDGNLLYLADNTGGLVILDVTNPAAPSLLGTAAVLDKAIGVHVMGDEAFVLEGDDDLARFNVSDPANPLVVGSKSTPYQSVQATGNDRFVVVRSSVDEEDGGSEIEVYQAYQDEVDERFGQAQSAYILGNGFDEILRVKLLATRRGSSNLSIVTGGVTENISLNGYWQTLDNPSNNLKWLVSLRWAPGGIPNVSSLTLDWLYDYAQIMSVADVPNDQGRQVRIEWKRSGHDFNNDSQQIVEYAVYRQVDSGLGKAGAVLPEGLSPLVRENAQQMKASGWDFVAAAPVLVEDYYSVVVPTLADSTAEGGAYRSVFRITALTATPGLFFHSKPDSGQSLDNLAPSVPANLLWTGPVLSWDDSEDEDFRHFTVYGSGSPILDGSEVMVGHATGPGLDMTGHAHAHYHVTATDFAGNESEAVSTSGVSGVPGADARFALHANVPNPFNPSTTIAFELPKQTTVRLRVLDVAGRIVRTLLDGVSLNTGRNEMVWDGRDDHGQMAAAGVYFYRVEAGRYAEARRMVLVK